MIDLRAKVHALEKVAARLSDELQLFSGI